MPATAVGLAPPAAAAPTSQPSPSKAAARRCVQENHLRYTVFGEQLMLQQFSLGGACLPALTNAGDLAPLAQAVLGVEEIDERPRR